MTVAAILLSLLGILFSACEVMSQPREKKSKSPPERPASTEVAGLPFRQGPRVFAVSDDGLAILRDRLVTRDLAGGAERTHVLPGPGRAIAALPGGVFAVAGTGFLCALAPGAEAPACRTAPVTLRELTHLWGDADPEAVWVLAGDTAQRWRLGEARATLVGTQKLDRRARLILAPLADGGVVWSDGLYVFHGGGHWVAPRSVVHLAAGAPGQLWASLAGAGGLVLLRLGEKVEVVRELAVGRVLSLSASPSAVAATLDVEGKPILVVLDKRGERLRVRLEGGYQVALSPTASRVFAGDGARVDAWDYETGQKL